MFYCKKKNCEYYIMMFIIMINTYHKKQTYAVRANLCAELALCIFNVPYDQQYTYLGGYLSSDITL